MTRRFFVAGIAPAIVRADTIQERGRKLIEEAQAALGGSKFLNMHDRVEKGRAYSYYRERLSGLSVAKFETFYDDSQPGIKQSDKQVFGKKEDYYVIFEAAGKGWDVGFRGAKPMPSDVVKQWQEGVLRNPMYILRCRTEEKGIIFERRGLEVFENQPVEIVDVTDADNREVAIYLNASTKLPVRGYFKKQNPVDKGWDEQDTRYAKYRESQGQMWPWAITRSRNGERNLEMYSDEVRFNSGLSANDFKIGPGAKMDPKAKPVK
ncbi:hypothetical protein [Bryobacter aggregatus]|uniref:hypothetical protein n=1 Tax=Bryobacter aggregatus TaxID=360054 RepID=UPI0012BA6DCE|nr:hypothetical protein [Bryobacter aggregatus]